MSNWEDNLRALAEKDMSDACERYVSKDWAYLISGLDTANVYSFVKRCDPETMRLVADVLVAVRAFITEFETDKEARCCIGFHRMPEALAALDTLVATRTAGRADAHPAREKP